MSEEINLSAIIKEELPHLSGLVNILSIIKKDLDKTLLYKERLDIKERESREVEDKELLRSLIKSNEIEKKELLAILRGNKINIVVDNSVRIDEQHFYSEIEEIIKDETTFFATNSRVRKLLDAEFRAFNKRYHYYWDLELHMKKNLDIGVVDECINFMATLEDVIMDKQRRMSERITKRLLTNGVVNKSVIDSLGYIDREIFLGLIVSCKESDKDGLKEDICSNNTVDENIINDIWQSEQNWNDFIFEVKKTSPGDRLLQNISRTLLQKGVINQTTIKKIGEKYWIRFLWKLKEDINRRSSDGLLVDLYVILMSILSNGKSINVLITKDYDFKVLGQLFKHEIAPRIEGLKLPENSLNLLYPKNGGFEGFSV